MSDLHNPWGPSEPLDPHLAARLLAIIEAWQLDDFDAAFLFQIRPGKWASLRDYSVTPLDSIRTLKTRTSRRLVPFHAELERLRLPKYVAALRDVCETLLFPELVAESGKGTTGDAFYKLHWTKIARCLDFIEPGQAIHSFRHTVADELKAQFVFEEVRADLVGHQIQSETGGRYSKRARLEPLHKAVNSIPNVTSTLPPPPVILLPTNKRKPRPARRPRG